VRQHQSTLSWEEATPWAAVGRTATGFVSQGHRILSSTSE
jgi:hypothetical protein